MRFLTIFVLTSCIENGTRENYEGCWADADCVDDLECYELECLTKSQANYQREQDEDRDGGGNIVCNDGTRSPSCTTCSSGCCSGHDGCD